ncbi:epoxide hydrolase family protein [Naasia sp. SYSU D00057]|uniref:epoxide hydrolase family protein n=1 Tax=Naasia sp. SYSU D00057 TaxID=2817380 RepID=UPI001B3131C0|nr:epoxide hydrolase family protein [Naasia sp. SYSU D00057]
MGAAAEGAVMGGAPEAVEEELLDDLRRRLRRTRFAAGVPGGWERGTEREYLEDLVRYWADDYDWRAAEARLLALPWVRAGNGMRTVHQRAASPDAPTVVLLHGWPDSFLRFLRVLPLLRDVNVVVPCLPGYPYSGLPGSSREAMAEPIAALLDELGHRRCVVSGGDIGSGAAETLARIRPDLVGALHLTDIPLVHLAALDPREATPEGRDYLDAVARWRAAEGGYIAEQSTKPNTLAAALADSPAGLAAWIVEKLRGWSDCGGDVETVFPRDDLLTWLTLYWVTGTIGTSFVPYAVREPAQSGRVAVPTVGSVFARDLLPPPRALAERVFDVRDWQEHEAGGHFAAWEQPEAFVRGVRAAVALLDED